MALLEMNKITLIAHASSKSALMKKLQSLGAVEIIPTDLEELKAAASPGSLSALESKLSEVREALGLIKKYDTDKPSFLTPKPSISRQQLNNIDSSKADKVISQIEQLTEEMNSLKSKKQRLKNRISQLVPFKSFDAPLESVKDNLYSSFLLGSIPVDNASRYDEIRANYAEDAYFETQMEDKESLSVFVAMHKDAAEKLTGELKYIGFSEAFIKDLKGTPANLISGWQAECDTIDSEAATCEERAKTFVKYKMLFWELEDFLTGEIERERSIEKLGETGAAFALEGWIVKNDCERVQKALLETAPESYITFREPLEQEIPPTAVKNSRLVEPFEMVTEMYSYPSSRGFDPNAVMSVFYFILFGMMIGDAAYGAIISIGAWIVLRLKKPTGTFRKVVKIVMYCGLSTIVWGLIFGTVFAIPSISEIALINPIENAMTTLILCLGVGVIHILSGLVVGAYVLIKRGEILAAVFDKISWIIVLTGGVMLAFGGMAAAIGMYMMIGGLVLVLLTAGRAKKGIFRKFISGFAGVYGATGYISDILSYSRLFGMGLATSVIAMVFNTIAGMFFGSVIGYIIGGIVLIAGHTFNIAINALGAFVHTARLQFIEFYSKFYEGGGHAFSPLGVKTRNFRLED